MFVTCLQVALRDEMVCPRFRPSVLEDSSNREQYRTGQSFFRNEISPKSCEKIFRIFWASDVGSSACRAINISVLSFSETCEFPIESGVHGHLCSHAFVKILRS